jgi:hypothetical protein
MLKELAILGIAGAGIYTAYDKVTTGTFWWEKEPFAPKPSAGIPAGIPVPMPVALVDNRPLNAIKADLENKHWSNQNAITQTASYVYKLVSDLKKEYPINAQKVQNELANIGQQRISMLKGRKEMALRKLEDMERQKKATEAQIRQLENQKRELTVANVGPERKTPDLWLSQGRLVEQADLAAELKQLDMQKQARTTTLDQQISILQSRMPNTKEAYKDYQHAREALEKCEEEYKAIATAIAA